MAGDYWVRITQEDRELGAGFVLTTCDGSLPCIASIRLPPMLRGEYFVAGGQSIQAVFADVCPRRIWR